MNFDSLSTFGQFALGGGLALVLALLTGLRERRERRRRDLDRISTVPWGFVSVLFSMLAIILLATAAKVWFLPAP